MEPWICHEAGHLTTALHLGFGVSSLKVIGGKPTTMCELDAEERTNEERYLFLAGGIAGEKHHLGRYDKDACADDQAKISALSGGPIESYLPGALDIVVAHKKLFDELKKKIKIKMLERQMVGMVVGASNTFEILSEVEIGQVWHLHK